MSKQEFHPFVLTLLVLKTHLPSSVSDAAISIWNVRAAVSISNVTMVYGGDVNADGSISLPDALTIMRSAMGIIPQLELDDADMDADDAVRLDDAILLARLCLGIE